MHPRPHVDERPLDHPVAGGRAGDLERLDDVDAGRDERRERAREARERDLLDDVADLHRDLQLEAVPVLAAALGPLQLPEAERRQDQGREDDEPVAAKQVGCRHHELRRSRQLAAEVGEDLLEHRDDEEEHEDEDEGREDQDDRRVDHGALDAPLELRLLLDLRRDAVEHRVERSRRLARLDHRDEEAVEDLRVARERAREHHAGLDVRPHLADRVAEVLVVGLLLERDERRDDADPGLDHRRELPREDLERLRLDLLEGRPRAALAARGPLGQRARQQAARLKLLGAPRPSPERG